MSIRETLIKATGQKPKGKDETLVAFQKRLADAAYKLKEDEWDKIDEDAQKWVNAASTAIDKKADPPAFDDEKDEDEEDKGGKGKGSKTKGKGNGNGNGKEKKPEPEPKAKGKDKPAAKGKGKSGTKGKDKPAAKEKEPKTPRGQNPEGTKYNIKSLVLKNRNLDAEAIVKQLKDKGIKTTVNTTSGVRTEFINTIALLVEKGAMKDPWA